MLALGLGRQRKKIVEKKMSKKLATRRELLERWRGIEEDEDDDRDHDHDPSQIRRLHQLKEQWFVTSLSLSLVLHLVDDSIVCLFMYQISE